MNQSIIVKITPDNWYFLIIIIIPAIVIILGVFVLKWFNTRIRGVNYRTAFANTDKRIKQLIIESSKSNFQIDVLKELINQLIKQRSLVSRIKAVTESYAEMIKSKQAFYNYDFVLIEDLMAELNKQIEKSEQYHQQQKFSSFEQTIIEQQQNTLTNIRELINKIINSIKELNYDKYSQLVEKVKLSYQSLVNMHQVIINHIQEQLSPEENQYR